MANSQSNPVGGVNKKRYYYLGSTVVVALIYFGFVQPAQKHMTLLQDQCDQLSAVVSKLNNQSKTAQRGLHLIDLLEKQDSKIAAAETALRELVDLRRRMNDETEKISAAMGSLDRLEAVRLQVEHHGQRLEQASQRLQQSDQIFKSIDASVSASHALAQQTESALQDLDHLQAKVTTDLVQVSDKLPNVEPVIEEVQELCEQIANSEVRVHQATVVSQKMTSLQEMLLQASETIPQAETVCSQLDSLSAQMAEQSATLELAEQKLLEFSQLKAQVLAQARDLSQATNVLTQLNDLREGLLNSGGTLGEIRHLLVDMVLLEPAVKRAQLSLMPVVEITRLSRRIESAMTPEAKKQKSSKPDMSDQVGNNSDLQSWSDLLANAVAWCQQTHK